LDTEEGTSITGLCQGRREALGCTEEQPKRRQATMQTPGPVGRHETTNVRTKGSASNVNGVTYHIPSGGWNVRLYWTVVKVSNEQRVFYDRRHH